MTFTTIAYAVGIVACIAGAIAVAVLWRAIEGLLFFAFHEDHD